MVLWVSTLTVSLPRTIAEIPLRPWEAITIKSHPFVFAASIIAWKGCSCSTWTVSQLTPAPAAASFTCPRYFVATAVMRFLYDLDVSVSISGSTAKYHSG